MSSSLYPCHKAALRRLALSLGAAAVGFARAGAVDPAAADSYDRWLDDGCNASMQWMRRHAPLRRDPRSLLPGARTVIATAWPYAPVGGYRHPHIADYALGRDYHRVVRDRLDALARLIADRTGALSRPCVDTAPLPERYWAVRAGIGTVGLNGQLHVPGIGAGVVLGTLLTTLELAPDEPISHNPCHRCGACLRACPGGALRGDGTLDARRCHSYLTIECPDDELPPGTCLGGRVYGCDICRRVCPLEPAEPAIEPLDEFRPDPRLLAIDRATLANLRSGDWRRLFADSPVRHTPARRIRRNAR
ncbi:MAG: tRNA epoxyqueuosine(34) reductase QueG [Bacteroidales bacterium]|nr:tRNA epoxyqueuosine(34) reductase QueG [Bacteroidales bacterium]